MILRLLCGLWLCLPVWAKPAADKTKCSKREVQHKDCRVTYKTYRIDLGADNVSINDGTWRKVEPQPLVGKDVEWHHVSIKPVGGRLFLEFLIWGEPATEAKLQELNWYVAELKGAEMKLLLSQVVQRRRLTTNKQGKPYTVLDKQEKFALKAAAQSQVQWTAGRASGLF